MIVTRLAGGLGNQMFQYAFGLWLAEKSGSTLFYDANEFEKSGGRRLGIEQFQISGRRLAEADRQRIPIRYRTTSRWKRTLAKLLPTRTNQLKLRREKPFGFDEKHTTIDSNLYLDGYWQSERFFPDFRDTLRREFRLVGPLSAYASSLSEQIEHCNGVAVHVRRGDYINVSENQKIYRALDPSWYRQCMDDLRQHVDQPRVFLFSDDIEWSMRHIDLGVPITPVVETNPDMPHEDMQLISRCRHAILANSTFSWWGALLAPPASDRRVYYPDPWFVEGSHDGRDIGCDDWISERSLHPASVDPQERRYAAA